MATSDPKYAYGLSRFFSWRAHMVVSMTCGEGAGLKVRDCSLWARGMTAASRCHVRTSRGCRAGDGRASASEAHCASVGPEVTLAIRSAAAPRSSAAGRSQGTERRAPRWSNSNSAGMRPRRSVGLRTAGTARRRRARSALSARSLSLFSLSPSPPLSRFLPLFPSLTPPLSSRLFFLLL
eukprot:scaffold148588_cov33-Tisochrysis_lutea.AAC.1